MFDDYIRFNALYRGGRTAVLRPSGPVPFQQFNADIDRAGRELREVRTAAGEFISVDIDDPYLHWVVVLALARLGLASVSGPDPLSALAVTDRASSTAEKSFHLARREIDAIFHGPAVSPQPRERDPDRLLRVLCSSGTTGAKKRIGLCGRLIGARVASALVAYGAPPGPWLASTGPDTALGFVVTIACWASGNPIVLGMPGKLDPGELLNVRPRLIALVPGQLRQLVESWPSNGRTWPLRLVSGGGPVAGGLVKHTAARVSPDLRSVYGSSEAGIIALADAELIQRLPQSAGFVLPLAEVNIVDETGEVLPRGESGEIRVRGERVAANYLDPNSGSLSAFRDGWFYSGDTGRLLENGQLLLEGRSDGLMNIGGRKVAPEIIENIAISCPGVTDAAACGVLDLKGFEACWLALVTDADFREKDLAAAAMREGSTWLPKTRVVQVKTIPRNAMGKVDRVGLRQMLGAAKS
jgi:2,3-dihydroxybenzoate-AMP ligase